MVDRQGLKDSWYKYYQVLTPIQRADTGKYFIDRLTKNLSKLNGLKPTSRHDGYIAHELKNAYCKAISVHKQLTCPRSLRTAYNRLASREYNEREEGGSCAQLRLIP